MRTLGASLAVLMLLAVPQLGAAPAYAQANIYADLLDGKGFVCVPVNRHSGLAGPLEFTPSGVLSGRVLAFVYGRAGDVHTWSNEERRFLTYEIASITWDDAFIKFQVGVITRRLGRATLLDKATYTINRTTLALEEELHDSDDGHGERFQCELHNAEEARKIIEDLHQDWLSKRRI